MCVGVSCVVCLVGSGVGKGTPSDVLGLDSKLTKKSSWKLPYVIQFHVLVLIQYMST